MRFTGLSLSQTPPRMTSTFLQHQPVTTTRQEGLESQLPPHEQLLLLHILTHEPFDIVDFILDEIEDVITNGMGVVRQFPYAHWISYICSMIVPAESPISAVYRQDEAPRFPVYRPTAPQDRRRGRQAERAAMAQLSPETQARVS